MVTPATSRGEARRRLASLFAGAGSASPDLDARILVCAACGVDHAGLIRDADLALDEAASLLQVSAARRLAREPVSRILGQREFWGLPLRIDATVLDPRPETEHLVATILDAVRDRLQAPLSLLDLGTGSGAILCALLRELPKARAIGVDRSFAACQVARRNLRDLGVGGRASVVCGSWLEAIDARFDAIASNPPYIKNEDLAGLPIEVAAFDPAAALDGGLDGLAAYRAIVPRLPGLLAPGGLAAVECGADQGDDIAAMMRSAGLAGVAVHPDLAGHDRVVSGGTSIR